MKLKRLIMLALCLALVCSLSVSAFAVYTHEGYEEYDGGVACAESYAQISQYRTSGYVDGEGYNGSASTGISCTYSYRDVNGVVRFDEMSCTQPVRSSVVVVYHSGMAQHMRYAYYDLWAQVPSSSGTYDYERTARLDYAD